MTRYAYDDQTFRLMRQRTETYSQDAWDYAPGGNVKQDTGYTYDLAGNIIETTENRTNAGFGTTLTGGQGPTPNKLVREFDYDPLYRLIMATGREDTSHSHNLIWQDTSPVSPTPANSREYRRTYQYDKMGNILKLAHTAHQASFTRNFGYHTSMDHNKLEKVLDNNQNTLTDFEYDAAGNLIQNNSERFYAWDAANQLKLFKIDDGQTVSVYGQYLYSGGQRAKKLVKDQQGNYTITVYIDGVFEYQKLVKGANTYERNYTHIMDDRSRIATVRAGSDEDDITEDAFYVVEDHLNTSTARLKATDGSVIDREEFYPFGETCLHSFSKKRYRYVGKEKDLESGLYYYGTRYYSAWTCRFISVDALAKKYNQLTPYQNAGNNPINDRDIDGNKSGKTPKGGGGEKGNSGKANRDSKGVDDSSNKTTENTQTHGGGGDMPHQETKKTGSPGDNNSPNENGETTSSIPESNNHSMEEPSNNSDSLNIPKGDVPEIEFENQSSETSKQPSHSKADISPMPSKPAPDFGPRESSPGLAKNSSSQPKSDYSNDNKKPWGVLKEVVGGLIQRFNSLMKEAQKTAHKPLKLAKFSAKAAKGVPVIGLVVAAFESIFIFRKEGNSFKGYWKSALAMTVALLGLIPFVGLAIGIAYAYADYKGYVDQWANRAEKNFNTMRNEFNKGMNALFEHPWRMFQR